MKSRISFFSALLVVLVAGSAWAQSKFTNLEDEPAIRNKLELRDDRVEVVPQGAFTLNSGLRQHFTFGARLRYHLSDVFALGISGFAGLSTPTGTFAGILELRGVGNEAGLNNGDPALDDLRRVREVKFGGSLDGEFTPIYGKMSLFGKVFFRYDLSAILGVAVVATDEIVDLVQNDEALRFIPGPTFGLGLRFFLNDFLALNTEIRDTLVLDNFDGGLVGNEPNAELNNFATFSLGLSVFFPTLPKISK